MKKKLNIGTCSWKYDSWQGLIYPEKKPFNYLEEYSKHYNCVFLCFNMGRFHFLAFGDLLGPPNFQGFTIQPIYVCPGGAILLYS